MVLAGPLLSARAGTMEFVATNYLIAEHSGSLALEVSRGGDLSAAATVSFATSNGTAIAGADFSAVGGQLVFAAGQATQTIVVPLLDDHLFEGREELSVHLFAPSVDQVLGQAGVAAVSIIDNEVASVPDSTAQSGNGANDDVFAFDLQPDGRLLVGGEFTRIADVSQGRFARLTTNGACDSSFLASGMGANSSVYSLAVQADGKILVGGAFTIVNNQAARYLVRITTNGLVDPAFLGTATINNELRAIEVLSDGKILITGRFTQVDGQVRGRIARLNADGSLDATFQPGTGANNHIRTLAVQADGRILIGGTFTSYNGTNRNCIARIESNGALDLSFNPGTGANDQVRAIIPLADGRIYIGGDFATYDHVARPAVARLLPDGQLDTSFNPGPSNGGAVRALALDDHDVLWIGGLFNHFHGVPRQNVARLNRDGSLFDDSHSPVLSANDEVFAIALQPDGRVWLGGQFSQVNGSTGNALVRLGDSVGARVRFAAERYELSENVGDTGITLVREGLMVGEAAVDFSVLNETATSGTDYTLLAERVVFAPLQTNGALPVRILDNPTIDRNRTFRLVPHPVSPTEWSPVEEQATAQVAILDNEVSGIVEQSSSFSHPVNGRVVALALDRAGGFYAGGDFTYSSSSLSSHFDHFLSNGEADWDYWNFSYFSDAVILAVAIQNDGKAVIGGDFTFANGQARLRLARLFTNGLLDTNFTASADGPVDCLALRSDGSIVVGGRFGLVNGVARPALAQLHADGTLDAAFMPPLQPPGQFASELKCVAVQPDGRVLLGGSFRFAGDLVTRHLARLRTDGSPDPEFTLPDAPNEAVSAITLVDGGMLIGGSFTALGATPRVRLARLTDQGVLDLAFVPTSLTPNPVLAVAVDPTKRVLAAGGPPDFDGGRHSSLVRLLPDGTPDPAFEIGSGPDRTVYAMALQPNGHLLIGGSFTNINGQPARYLARLNDDAAAHRVEFTLPARYILESAGGCQFDLRRVGSSAGETRVELQTVDGTASNGSDFVGQSETLVFTNLETLKTITIPIINDHHIEVEEWFSVRLTNLVAGIPSIIGTPSNAVVRITDNDHGFQFSRSLVVFREATNLATVEVVRSYDTSHPASVDVVIAGGTADATDYVFAPTTLVFLPGEWTKTLSIPLINDGVFEGRETLVLALTNVSSGDMIGSPSNVVVNIDDQDSEFDFGIWAETVEPGGPKHFCVYRYGNLSQPASVRVRTAEGTATSGLDFVPIDLRLDFPAGSWSQCGEVLVLNDGLVEGMETFVLALSDPTGTAIVREGAQRIINMYDNDQPIGFTTTDFYINEFSSNAVLRVMRGDDGTNNVTVQFTTQAGSAVAGTDFRSTSGTLVIPPNATNIALSIPLIDDRDWEPTKTFFVTLSNPVGEPALGTQSVAAVHILDNELAGSLDLSFLPSAAQMGLPWGCHGNGWVSLAQQPDGMTLVGACGSVARCDATGAWDTNFTSGAGALGETTPLVQPDGRILVGLVTSNSFFEGYYTVARLLTNGARDLTFSNVPLWGRTRALALQDDGKLLLGGTYDLEWWDGLATNNALLRLNPDGTTDTNFNAGTFAPHAIYWQLPTTVETIAVQPDGKILAAGLFTSVGGVPCDRVARFQTNGALDPAFLRFAPTGDGVVRVLVLETDGNMLAGGTFAQLQGAPCTNLVRLRPDGTVAPGFGTALASNQNVTAIAVQPDGRILVAGYWGYHWAMNAGFVIRLRPDGQLDATFDCSPAPDVGVTDLKLLPGGDVLIGGSFSTVNGAPQAMVARLKGDGLRLAYSPASQGGSTLYNVRPGRHIIWQASTNLVHWQPVLTNHVETNFLRFMDHSPASWPSRFYRAVEVE